MLIPPRLFSPLTCAAPTPTTARSIGVPADSSAASMARRIERTAASRLMIAPFFQPFDSAQPQPRNRSRPCSSSAATRTQVLALPASKATRLFCLLLKSVHHDLPVVTQVDGVDLRNAPPPFLYVSEIGFVARQETARTKMQQGPGVAHHHARVLRIAHVHFRKFLCVMRAGAVEFLHHGTVEGHAPAALFCGVRLPDS